MWFCTRGRSSRTGWPFRRDGIGVPARRHHRSGATRKASRTESKLQRATKDYANASSDGFARSARHPAGEQTSSFLSMGRNGNPLPHEGGQSQNPVDAFVRERNLRSTRGEAEMRRRSFASKGRSRSEMSPAEGAAKRLAARGAKPTARARAQPFAAPRSLFLAPLRSSARDIQRLHIPRNECGACRPLTCSDLFCPETPGSGRAR